MPTNISKTKLIGYSTAEVYTPRDHDIMVEEHVEVELIVPNSTDVKDVATNAAPQNKLPHFFEHKIRVRKYDFL